eukprot:CAMPEP_0184478378 /NCGR_PEP_ID=MMETSP0113_2-20130426/424_1 /TAXON_ID=91329 /ORGANISM="Norrisiella sphaerica, Strain BC52" /LENGTH=149 /DNA_ID=CAMNT_0026856147 /DNA_START=640 /DNA_END=1089 /DNA_ORIENTATION=-
MAENFNISIPYIQLSNIILRKSSKFGKALVLQTNNFSGNYTLGFRIDPEQVLKEVHQEIKTLYDVFSKKPNFSVKYKSRSSTDTKAAAFKDDVEIVSTSQMEHFDTLTRYYADPGKSTDRKPVYDESLGLAIEETKSNIPTSKLWTVVV